jgi:hypothetical protein
MLQQGKGQQEPRNDRYGFYADHQSRSWVCALFWYIFCSNTVFRAGRHFCQSSALAPVAFSEQVIHGLKMDSLSDGAHATGKV